MIAIAPKEESRGTGLMRLLWLAHVLRMNYRPATVADIAHDLEGYCGGSWHERTVRRDLVLLADLGVADRDGRGCWSWRFAGNVFEVAGARQVFNSKGGAA